MRVAILTVGSRGDVQPFLAFGAALQRSGHRVRICTHPGFESLVRDQGFEFAPLAAGALARRFETEAGRRWAQRSSRWMPAWVGLLRDARSVARRRLSDAAAGCEGAEVIVASNLTQLLGWQIARERELPLVRAMLNAPNYWMARRSSPRAAAVLRQLAWLMARPWLDAVRRDAMGWPGLPAREPIGALERGGALTLHPFSPAVFPPPPAGGPATAVTGYWFLEGDVDPAPDSRLRTFLEAGPAPVYAGFGIQIDHDPVATTRAIVDALRRAGRRGVLQRPPEALAGVELGEDMLAVGPVPHGWVFARCCAVVHHGAAGTTATALRAGVPSVIVPHNSDQFSWGRRMAQLGVSPAPVPRRRLSAERLGEAIAVAVNDADMRRRVQELGRQIRSEDGAAAAAAAFERYLATWPAGATVERAAPESGSGRRAVRMLPNGLRVHGATPGDARSQHFIDGYFDGGLVIGPGMTVLDIGANIGLFALEALRRAEGDLELYAFEPAPETFGYLQCNVQELFPRSGAHLQCAAVADAPGEATLYHRPRASVTSSLYREVEADSGSLVRAMLREPPERYRELFPPWLRRLPGGAAERILQGLARWSQGEVVPVRCPVTTVSRVIAEHGIERIDFLKVDVEGAELAVLHGIDAQDWPRIKRLAVEVHDIDGRLEEMRTLLTAAGFAATVEQEWPFEGTDVYMLHAVGAGPPSPLPAGVGAVRTQGSAPGDSEE